MTNINGATSHLRIATCPVNWNNNDIPGFKPVTPFPEILDRMHDDGYAATEYDASFGNDPVQVCAQMDSHDLVLTGSYQWVDFLTHGADVSAYENLRPTLALLAELGCRHLIVSDSLRPHRVALAGRVPEDGSESLDDASYARIAAGIHAVATMAAEYGIKVHYHNHVGSWIEAPHEVAALLAQLDTSCADLCFDTGHYAYGGGNPAQFIQDNIAKIGYLHLKDVDTDAVVAARARELTFLEALREYVFSPIGTGSADIPAILSVLVENEFDGWIVVEQETSVGDPTETARQNLAFIEHWLENHQAIGR